jgi:ankyrin repeat protein
LLLEAGAAPGDPLLRNAVKQNHPSVVKALLAHTKEPLAPLFRDALRQHHTEIALLLLESGVDVNARDEAGFTPLHDAALAGNTAAVRTLLDHGANVNIRDKDSGATALYMAATMGREDVVNLLLERGADPKIGPSPIKAAKDGGFDKIAEAIKAK